METRKTQILDENRDWVDYNFRDLRPGDTFRLFEPDGSAVEHKNQIIFNCSSMPFQTRFGETLAVSVAMVTSRNIMMTDRKGKANG